MRLRYTLPALADLDQILDYIVSRSPQGARNVQARIRTVIDQLQLGKAVLVFPEGERTLTGSMQPLKPGVHLLIKWTKAPIIPVGIAGAYDAWPRWRSYPIPAPLFWPPNKGTIAVSIGRPLDANRFASLPRARALQELFDEIEAVQRRAEKLRRQ